MRSDLISLSCRQSYQFRYFCFIFLMATTSLSCSRTALNTVPKEPSPKVLMILYFYIFC